MFVKTLHHWICICLTKMIICMVLDVAYVALLRRTIDLVFNPYAIVAISSGMQVI